MAKWQQQRSFWTWGYESDEPSDADRKAMAERVSKRLGREVVPPPVPSIDQIELRAPRLKVPDALPWVSSEHAERVLHTHGGHSLELLAGLRGEFAEPPDAVAHPRNEDELEATLGGDPWRLHPSDLQRPHARPATGADGPEVDERERNVLSLEPRRPLSGLIVLRRQIQDLAPGPGDVDEGVHDLARASVVARAERLVEQQRQAVPFLMLEEAQTHGDQQLDAFARRELGQCLLDAGHRVVGTEHAIIAGRGPQLETAGRDAGEERAGAHEHLGLRGLPGLGADPRQERAPDRPLFRLGAGPEQVVACGDEPVPGLGHILKLSHLAEDDRMSQRDVRRGGVETELDAQRFTGGHPLLELLDRIHVVGAIPIAPAMFGVPASNL